MIKNKDLQTLKTIRQVFFIVLLFSSLMYSQEFSYNDSWGASGFTLTKQSNAGIEVNFSVPSFTLADVNVFDQTMKAATIPGIFLPNDAGKPDLAGTGRYIAIPTGASVKYTILSYRKEVYQNIEIAPAPVLPLDNDDSPLIYEKDGAVYGKNAYYPESPVSLSDVTTIRGVEAVMLGITPFQYNPVTKELIVYKDLKVQIDFQGGKGTFGDEAYRNRWWEPILSDVFLNYSSLPAVDFDKRDLTKSLADGYEYVIIVPNNPEFSQWADTLRRFRIAQGIKTGIFKLSDIGGNVVATIKNWVNNAYNNWTIKPVAICLLGDYGTDANSKIITILQTHPASYPAFASDNYYSDVNGDEMPEIVFSRIIANDATQLQTLITKNINYERNPPTSYDFYNKPITALGWQTERWFQICSEVLGGYFKKKHGKLPTRINKIYSGTPGTTWSTATNTSTVVNYFGYPGRNYIPMTPDSLGGWDGGTATMVNNAINSGSFLLQHRDHGEYVGWGEPSYNTTNIGQLTNTDLTFVYSINCETGAYHNPSGCPAEGSFVEVFYRHKYNGQNSGALGLVCPSEVSYSFVNDTYCWGMYDNMWPDFLPDYGTTPPSRDVKPAFGMAAGKYFLQQSSWPYNTSDKLVTYRLFHMHGDAFLNLYYNVPQNLTVNCPSTVVTGATSISISANEGALIALTIDTTIIGTGTGLGAGNPVMINIPGNQVPPQLIKVVITKQNYYRYENNITVIPNSGAYIVHDSLSINDASPLGNGNGLCDYGETNKLNLRVKNVGSLQASNVVVKVRSNDPYVVITDSSENYGVIAANTTKTVNDAFTFNVLPTVPDGRIISFTVVATSDTNSWISGFSITAHAPVMALGTVTVNDSIGNNNGRWDVGETVKLLVQFKNTGSCNLTNAKGKLIKLSEFVTITADSISYGTIPANGTLVKEYIVTSSPSTPVGHTANFNFKMYGQLLTAKIDSFNLTVGKNTFVIGTGTTAVGWPFYTYYHDSRTQMLYLASELLTTGASTGNVTKIAFDVVSPAAQVMNGFYIRMKNTPLTSLSAWETGFTDVYSGTYAVPGSGWQTINLQTPFAWDGIQNLLIEICFDNTSYTSNTTVNSSTTTGTLNRHYHMDNGTGCTMTSTSTAATRPNITLTMEMMIPVELVSFSSAQDNNNVVLAWTTATETNNSMFVIERRINEGSYQEVGKVSGRGTSTEPMNYSFTDKSVPVGKYTYRLKQVDFDGTSSYSKTLDVNVIAPKVYALEQNYPNPFNPSTLIKYSIAKDGLVNLSVYNVLGEKVMTLVNEVQKANSYSINFNATGLASGVYFYKLESGNYNSIKKMIFIK